MGDYTYNVISQNGATYRRNRSNKRPTQIQAVIRDSSPTRVSDSFNLPIKNSKNRTSETNKYQAAKPNDYDNQISEVPRPNDDVPATRKPKPLRPSQSQIVRYKLESEKHRPT